MESRRAAPPRVGGCFFLKVSPGFSGSTPGFLVEIGGWMDVACAAGP